jgi:hypothetical protein
MSSLTTIELIQQASKVLNSYVFFELYEKLMQSDHVFTAIHFVLKLNFGTIYYHYSVALVRKRTIPSDRPPLVGEVSVNVCG